MEAGCIATIELLLRRTACTERSRSVQGSVILLGNGSISFIIAEGFLSGIHNIFLN